MLIITLMMLLAMTGCNKSENSFNHKDVITEKPTLTEEATEALTKEPTTIPTLTQAPKPEKKPTNQVTKEPQDNQQSAVIKDLSKFKKIQDSFVNYSFTPAETKNIEGTEYLYSEGAYDVNQDGNNDTISALIATDEAKPSYLTVNNIKINLETEIISPSDSKIYLIDINQEDNFKEIAVFGIGYDDYHYYSLFRYDGKKVYCLGTIEGNALMDQYGKLVSTDDLTTELKPMFCSAWYEVKDNALVQKSNDIKEFMGKTYDFAGGTAFFAPCTKPDQSLIVYENPIEYEPCKIKLISVYQDPGYGVHNYFVELPTGEKGLLYFFIRP
jgi:hypothetical protein